MVYDCLDGLAQENNNNGAVNYVYKDAGLRTSITVTGQNMVFYKYDNTNWLTNVTRTKFTAREDDGTGLYYYRARYFHPALGRFVSEDPMGYGGGNINIYAYSMGNPVNLADPLGLTCESNLRFLIDWLTGGGEPYRVYQPDSVEMQEMMRSPGAKAIRQAFVGGGCKDITSYEYDTWRAASETLLDPCSTAAQVGGFGGATAIRNPDGSVTITIRNVAGTHSFFYHLVPDRSSSTGPMRNITQVFQWTEKADCPPCPKSNK